MTSRDDITVRRPRAGDWQQVMTLLERANFHRIGGAEMARFEPEDCFVAEVDGRVAGVAGYAILDPETAKTTLMVVDAALRLRGVGTALHRHRLDYLRGLGIRVLYTNCDDPAVIAWNCRHFGFAPTGRMIPKQEDFGRRDKDAWTNLRLDLDPDSRAMLPSLPAGGEPRAPLHDLTEAYTDAKLLAAVDAIVAAMRRDQARFLNQHFTPEPDAATAVTEAALAPLLERLAWVSDIVEQRRLSN